MLGKLLGKGSDGEIYELLKDSDHVVKYIQPKICGIENYLEYYIMLYSNHPNIVKAKEIELTEHSLIKIVQKKAVSDLSKKVKNKKYIIKQIVEGVRFLNKHNIIHGDIKPSNILLFEDEKVKLNDLSLCRFSDSKSKKQLYTYHYRPPEIDKEELHINSDIYALGCTIYEIYFNEPFHDKRYPTRIHVQKKKTQQNSLFLDLIENMTELDPNERYSIDEVCDHSYFSSFLFDNYNEKSFDNYQEINKFAYNLELDKIFVSKCMNEKLDICKNYSTIDKYVSNVLKFKIFDYNFENDFF